MEKILPIKPVDRPQYLIVKCNKQGVQLQCVKCQHRMYVIKLHLFFAKVQCSNKIMTLYKKNLHFNQNNIFHLQLNIANSLLKCLKKINDENQKWYKCMKSSLLFKLPLHCVFQFGPLGMALDYQKQMRQSNKETAAFWYVDDLTNNF